MASSDSGSVWSFHILSGSVGAWFVGPWPTCLRSARWCRPDLLQLGLSLRRDTGLVALLPLHTGKLDKLLRGLGPIAIVLADHYPNIVPHSIRNAVQIMFSSCIGNKSQSSGMYWTNMVDNCWIAHISHKRFLIKCLSGVGGIILFWWFKSLKDHVWSVHPHVWRLNAKYIAKYIGSALTCLGVQFQLASASVNMQ